MKEEIWKDIEGYEGLYQVSNLGRVRSLDRILKYKDGRKRFYKGVILSARKNKNVYKYVSLKKNGKEEKKLLHRLVAEAFIPNSENKVEVNHINGIKTDNQVENLEWATHKENQNHAVKTGLKKSGTKSYQAKLTGKQVIEIREEYASGKVSQRELAKRYGLTANTMWHIIHKKTYKTE